MSQMVTNVTWRWHVPQKHWSPLAGQHSIITEKNIIKLYLSFVDGIVVGITAVKPRTLTDVLQDFL
jgi:hypothetical protein